MSFSLITRRAAAFVRSCFPADPASWLLLLGATFQFISLNLRWWPQSDYYSKPLLWAGCSYLVSLPICVAGVTAYYLGLVGGKKPTRRLLDSILLPAAIGLFANVIVAFFWFRDAGEPAYFVGQLPGAPGLWEPRILLALAVNLGTGFQFASLGFILVASFYVLYIWRRATLPIRLPAVSVVDASSSEDEHRRTMFFVWMMVAMVFITGLPEVLLAVSGYVGIIRFMQLHPDLFLWLHRIFYAIVSVAFVCVAFGKSGRKMIPAMLRIPRIQYLAIAALIPAAIAFVGPLATYFHSRMLWSLHGWGQLVPPSQSAFFGLPAVGSLWYFLPALVEEIGWRGYLQPRFIRRYGLFRGIFLVGVVWGAFHYSWDPRSYATARDVCIGLIGRLVATVCLSYVLAWLTIRSESILPAAVAHAGYNAFLTALSLPIRNPEWLTLPLWAVTGFVLLRFFPPPSPAAIAESAIPPASEPEPSEV
jgi:membrane protease YdiL (CAAX protease family)